MDLLQVKSNQIVNARGQSVRLRGTAVGGWMNMENFINGYPGNESGIRMAAVEMLGARKAEFLFERWLDYFLNEDDIRFIKQSGANVVRLALNYRHFESDAEPFKFLEKGFARLQQIVNWCAQHELYVILDMHSVQGSQNPDWHSDNKTRHALLWEHPHFQDRYVALWEELARRYVGNTTIAAYDVMNEPMTAQPHTPNAPHNWAALNAVQRRVVDAIRQIDPAHIIFLEGDSFGSRFEGLAAPFADNLAYSSHNYSAAGFGPGKYPGEYFGNWRDRPAYHEIFRTQPGTQFAQQQDVPLWVGEFGSVYNGPQNEIPDRLRALDDQIDIFEAFGAHWTTWTYKDVGVMGWVTLDPESEYMQLMKPVLDAKRELDTDSWMGWLPTTPAKDKLRELTDLIVETLSDPDVDAKHVHEGLRHAALSTYTGALLHPLWAKQFKGMTESDIDRVLQSFALTHCRPHDALLSIVRKHMARA